MQNTNIHANEVMQMFFWVFLYDFLKVVFNGFTFWNFIYIYIKVHHTNTYH
jgi:hypothetical protein